MKPAIEGLVDVPQLTIGNIWGDRGLTSKSNFIMLEKRSIGNGLCPRNVSELADKLSNNKTFA